MNEWKDISKALYYRLTAEIGNTNTDFGIKLPIIANPANYDFDKKKTDNYLCILKPYHTN